VHSPSLPGCYKLCLRIMHPIFRFIATACSSQLFLFSQNKSKHNTVITKDASMSKMRDKNSVASGSASVLLRTATSGYYCVTMHDRRHLHLLVDAEEESGYDRSVPVATLVAARERGCDSVTLDYCGWVTAECSTTLYYYSYWCSYWYWRWCCWCWYWRMP
jgi:hypothetical protein